MLEFSIRLRENPNLLALLSHYATLGADDRTIWQDRVMQMEGVGPQELTVLHGELIAFDWVEQNTGHAVLLPDGTLGACYRITLEGLWEHRRLNGSNAVEEIPEESKKAPPRVTRKRKDKTEPKADGIVE